MTDESNGSYTSQPLTSNYAPAGSGATRQNHRMPTRQFDARPGRVELGMYDRMQQPTVWSAVGYPRESEFTFDTFWLRYERQAEARAIIDKPVDDTWQDRPDVVDEAAAESDDAETEFEEKVEELLEGEHTWRRPTHRMSVADKLARLGEYSLIVIGFADGRDLSEPVRGVGDDEEPEFDGLDDLEYVATFGQDRVLDWETETDMTSPRYRRPTEYEVVTEENVDEDVNTANHTDAETQTVHWSRVLHVPEGELENDLTGTPALKPVFHELLNIDKIKAGSGEGYWRGGYQGLVVTPPEVRSQDGSTQQGTFSDGGDAVKDEIDEFLQNFERTIATTGSVESIDMSISDPTPHLEIQYKGIEVALDIPRSVFTGADRADTADAQAAQSWQSTIGGRRNGHATTNLFEPFLQRLIDVGVLPEPDGDSFASEWPPQDELSEQDEADLLETEMNARRYASPNDDLTTFWSEPEIRQMFGDHPERGMAVDDEFIDEFGPSAEEEDDEAEQGMQVDEDALEAFQQQVDGQGGQPPQQQPGQQSQPPAQPDGGDQQ